MDNILLIIVSIVAAVAAVSFVTYAAWYLLMILCDTVAFAITRGVERGRRK